MAMLTQEMIASMVKTIVEEVDPKQVILFGSQVQGDVGKHSDVDFLIVEDLPFGPKRSRREEIKRVRRALSPYRIAKDILVYSESEVDEWRQTRNHIISKGLRDGLVLYERL